MESLNQNDLPVVTKDLTKSFGPVIAVAKVNLSIGPGEIYALVGPNGSGKTTLLKLMVGLLASDKGSTKIYGNDISSEPIEAKKLFAFISDDPRAYDYLTGKEFLALTGNLRQISPSTAKKRIEEIANIFPLKEILNQRMGNYSRGNRQKLAFLAGFLAQPKIFFIDEPIVGLDPASIKILGEQLRQFAKNGGTVLFSTHILDFAKNYADRVGVMVEGRIIREMALEKNTPIDELYQEMTKTE